MTRTALGLILSLLGGLAACNGGDDASEGDPGGGNTGGGGVSTGTTNPAIAPARYFLRIEDSPPSPVVLDLDRDSALELFGEEASRDIVVLQVDTAKLLRNVLVEIQNACGTSWALDPDPTSPAPANPMYDCAATALGATFGPMWPTSPEFALVRLLTMTPANANVTATSLSDFAQLFIDNPNLFTDINNFGDVLAESLGIPRTSPFIPSNPINPAEDNLVLSLQQSLLATHPAISDPGGKTLPVTLYEALNNLTPLASKLGPVGMAPWTGPGEHPGVLVPDDATFTTQSDVLSPAFRMRVTAESNLRWVAGLDLGGGAGDMFLSDAAAPLSFDFNDPERLQITGITENPTIDMRFSVKESPSAVPSCIDPAVCKTNYPTNYPDAQAPLGAPVGMGTLWTVSPFLLEPIIARGGLLTYDARVFSRCYLILGMDCLVGVDIASGGDPPGWTLFTSDLMSVEVPQPQFIWELLTEVSQVVLHDPTRDGVPDIPEGGANPVFALQDVSIGLTAAEIVAAMRPSLQSQADKIANVILGRYWERNDALDFYYGRPGSGGSPYLYFAAPTDLRPDPANPEMPKPYTYEKPGFFTSPDLDAGSKVSTTIIDGVADTTHEKYRLPVGETTLYMQDDEGDIYAVRFYAPAVDSFEIVAQPTKL